MGNNNSHLKESNLELKKKLQSLNLNYIFYWQSNLNPFSKNESQTWNAYDDNIQFHLNLKYKQYLEDKNNFYFPLLHPSNNYNVDFKDMRQVHQNDTYRIRPIKVEKLKPTLINKTDQDFVFFWKANKDPWNQNEETLWSPYDEEDQFILKEAYNKYLEHKIENIVNLKILDHHFIDFSKMVQSDKLNPYKQRPVQRCHPKLVSNILRKNRMITSNEDTTFLPEIVEKQYLNKDDIKKYFKNIENQKLKKLNKIYFNVFPEFQCELEIEKELCFFEDNFSIEVSLKEIKSILIQEISYLSKCDSNSNENTAKSYLSQIEKIIDYKSFFIKMVFIYTMEGYLYKQLNFILRKMIISDFEKIKYYYTCLLFSFQYFSKITKFNTNNDLIVWRASKFSQEEFQAYEAKNKRNIIRIFKEFLSTSKEEKKILNFFDKNDTETKEFLWEIRIPKEIIKNEPNNFADISNSSKFDEKEILIRSGAIIQIDQILPYTEKKGNAIIEYPNKFKKTCTLKSFSLKTFLNLISFDPSIEELYLGDNKLGEYENSMLLLKEALEKNNTLKELNLYGNKLGENDKNIEYLKEALLKNNSIQNLNLYGNELGVNIKNMMHIKKALQKNNSIQTLNLQGNYLGGNENNMNHLKEALQINKSIQNLYLSGNELGRNENNMKNLKEALQKNNIIQELDLSGNELGINENNIKHLKDALQANKSIKKLNLEGNELGINENNMKHLKDAFQINKSIKRLNLRWNKLNRYDNNIKYLDEALKKMETIEYVDIYGNNLELQIKDKITNINKIIYY